MRPAVCASLALALGCLTVGAARGHFAMLLPQSPAVKKGEPIVITYQWGHPFEHQLFHAPAPESLLVLPPDGSRKVDLLPFMEKITVPTADKKTVTAYRWRFIPEQRGDFIFVLRTPPIWMEESHAFLQDTVRVTVHVQAQKGWDAAWGGSPEIVPLTRPYGLQPGMVFQAQTLYKGQPLAGALAEIERYHPRPPRTLPPDEHITRTAKTDPNGVITSTLTDAGWWCVAVQHEMGQREYDGKKYPLRQRAVLWAFVDEKAVMPASK